MKQKSTSKNKQKLSNSNNITVIFGYGLFLLIVLSVLLWTIIPLGNILFYPTARHFNIVVLLITFTVAAILPALGSYIMGDRSTHIKNKVLHHYNGVLFGLAAYWVASALGWVGHKWLFNPGELPTPLSHAVAAGIPVALTIAVMAFVAVTYTKKRRNKASVLEHRPYQIVLIGSMSALYLSMATEGSLGIGDILWASVLSLAFPLLIALISYGILAKYHSSRSARLTDAVVAMSIAHITASSIGPFISFLNLHWIATMVWSYIFAVATWIIYLYLRSRKSA